MLVQKTNNLTGESLTEEITDEKVEILNDIVSPTAEDRLQALESVMLDMIMGG